MSEAQVIPHAPSMAVYHFKAFEARGGGSEGALVQARGRENRGRSLLPQICSCHWGENDGCEQQITAYSVKRDYKRRQKL